MTDDLGTHIKQQLGNLKAFGVLDYIENLEEENAELKYALSSSMTEQGFLENEIKNFKSGAEYKALADMVDSLQKENAELKKDKEWLDNTNNEQTEVILKLNEQIEKMKCCHNCKNFINKSYCITPCEEHSEWKLAE